MPLKARMNLSVASFVTCPYCESAFFCLAEGRQVLFSACRNTLLVEVARLYVPDSQGTSGRASHSIFGSDRHVFGNRAPPRSLVPVA